MNINADIRNLGKWLNEEQAAPIDRQALARLLAWAQMADEQEPVGRTDQEIVDETEALAKWLMAWSFNHHPATNAPIRESEHPFAKSCWAAACHIQEMLTATDPENALAELEDATQPSTSQVEKAQSFPQEAAEFKAWFDAWYVGDGEQGETIPGQSDPHFLTYIDQYTLGFGAWMAAKHAAKAGA